MDIIISNSAGVPIYEQITQQMKGLILRGELKEGEALPSMRLLARELRISVITTKRAYEELERKGIIKMTRGKGTFVREQARQESSAKVRAMSAIERLLDEMEALSFSPQEIQMFFNPSQNLHCSTMSLIANKSPIVIPTIKIAIGH